MTNGIVLHTLATLGYALASFFPQSAFLTSAAEPMGPLRPAIREYVHVVKPGETLISIAEKYYGSRDYWTTVWNDNEEIINPSTIEIDSTIKIRGQKPLLVEIVKEERMARFNQQVSPALSPSLAFAVAQPSNIEDPIASAPIVSSPAPETAEPADYGDVYKQAGEKYGVPWQVLYGLHVTETGQRDGAIFNAEGSGAQGPMQFMPGTWQAFGVDGTGDGVADINNAVDAIHGAANFLARHGGVDQGLYYYGGNTSGTLSAACSQGYCP